MYQTKMQYLSAINVFSDDTINFEEKRNLSPKNNKNGNE